MDVGNSLEKLLTDPGFMDHADEKFQELHKKSKQVGTESSLRQDVDELLDQCQKTLKSVLDDDDIAKLIRSTMQIAKILSPMG